uniref:T-complex protein 1 subunit delta n=1 Tax=Spongospora subterranea TaxID=70186 RepID=A0A0H5R5Z4_9EUKA|eukprot:CRZ09192.1 hypothetical protein [Spongospora subterranea]
MAVESTPAAVAKPASGDQFSGGEKGRDVRSSNIVAAKAVADCIRTSLGPRGMDKMITSSNGEVVITNDGATILSKLEVSHPAARMLVDVSKSQDVEAGDGTTSVTVITGGLLQASQNLMEKGIHPSIISNAFGLAASLAQDILTKMATKVDLSDKASLVQAATTSLNSKVVSAHSTRLAPLAVEAVFSVIDPATASNVDLRDIKVVQKLGGTVDDTEMIHGLVFPQHASHAAGGPTRISNAKIALIQFCLSAPKTDMENSVLVSDYQQMDRILREERKYILGLVKVIVKSGCNVLLIQKSILRDAVNDLSLHFLAKKGIMVVTDVEREDVEFVSKTLGLSPIANIDSFSIDKMGAAEMAEEVSTPDGKLVKITGVKHPGRTVSILVRGSNRLMLEEAERSVHDALCVIRCLIKQKYMIAGGGAPEIEVSMKLAKHAQSLVGMESYCIREFANALEVIPFTLAENAGLNPMEIVTELKSRHAQGAVTAGINVRKGCITDILEENVVQPLLVTTSAINLATECVRMLLKIDDIVAIR